MVFPKASSLCFPLLMKSTEHSLVKACISSDQVKRDLYRCFFCPQPFGSNSLKLFSIRCAQGSTAMWGGVRGRPSPCSPAFSTVLISATCSTVPSGAAKGTLCFSIRQPGTQVTSYYNRLGVWAKAPGQEKKGRRHVFLQSCRTICFFWRAQCIATGRNPYCPYHSLLEQQSKV